MNLEYINGKRRTLGTVMEKLKDTFGISRVLEPRTAVPTTAWKVDNSYEISTEECRIKIERIHIERDSFQQLCSAGGYNESGIASKIIDVVSRRGKLHNPFTNSGGVLFGEIDEMGKTYEKHKDLKKGDKVITRTTITALPIYIEKIKSIDYNYGEIEVEGYAIVFLDSPINKTWPGISLSHTLSALDESGSLHTVFSMAERGKEYLVIGKDLVSTLIYSKCIRKAIGRRGRITAVLDSAGMGNITAADIMKIVFRTVDNIYLGDISKPVEFFNNLAAAGENEKDVTVEGEDMSGAEVLGVLLTKNRGELYFSSVTNSYIQSVLVAESMGKELTTYTVDQYVGSYEEFTIELLKDCLDELHAIDRLYESKGMQGVAEIEEESRFNASRTMQSLEEKSVEVAGFDCNVIIQGEKGIGKERVLEKIHENSSRKSEPCIRVSCGTLSPLLLEEELFGTDTKKGIFEQCDKGIIFFDEIGKLDYDLQGKVLKVLQEGILQPIGSRDPVEINVRTICSSTVPLRQFVEDGSFRADLYYLISIYTIEVPPLRERPDDIYSLSQIFLEEYCKRYKVDKDISREALAVLINYDWPGNIRELENMMQRLVIGVKSHMITAGDIDQMINENLYEDLIFDVKSEVLDRKNLDFNLIIAGQEKKLVEYALKKCGTTRKAAEFLNMTQTQLMRKKSKYDL